MCHLQMLYNTWIYVTRLHHTEINLWLLEEFEQAGNRASHPWKSSLAGHWLNDSTEKSLHFWNFPINHLPNNPRFNPLPSNKILDKSKMKYLQMTKTWLEYWLFLVASRKHCGKRRKCWLPAFPPFPTMFSNGLSLKVVKSQDWVVES